MIISLIYDSLILLAITWIATIPILFLTAGEAIPATGWQHWLYLAYLLLVIYIFVAWSWVKGGQTIGMRSWRIKVVNDDSTAMTWFSSLKRFLAAILSWLTFGLGYLLILRTPYRSLHDRLSKTHLVYIPKSPRN